MIRDSNPSYKITDGTTLLLAMLASERAITGDVWKQGYSNVNLNPDTELPIEVWLSKISEHLVAGGEDDRLISHGYSPTDDELMIEHGKKHLRSIKIPACYEMLTDEDKKKVMTALSLPGKEVWAPESIMHLPPALNITAGKNLSYMFKYVQAMKEAVALGVAEPSDLVPDWSKSKLQNDTLVQIRAQKKHHEPSTSDIGVCSSSDLSSFALRALPGESAENHFKRLCLARSRGGKLEEPSYIEMTNTQVRLFSPTTADLAVGTLLKEANSSKGVKMGLRRQNMIGEVEGLCRQSNTDQRIDKLEQAMQISATMEEFATLREEKKIKKAVKKAAVAVAAAKRKDAALAKKAEKEAEFETMSKLLGHPPSNGRQYKVFI